MSKIEVHFGKREPRRQGKIFDGCGLFQVGQEIEVETGIRSDVIARCKVIEQTISLRGGKQHIILVVEVLDPDIQRSQE